MTDRHAGYIVTLTKDIREDDAEAIINALRMVRGVQSVAPVVAEPELHIAEMRARSAMKDRVWEFYKSIDSTEETS